MAADNVTLGRFSLDGIPPAPRGVPRIEVTFDIDVNGIVHVSAKDLGTGKEQKISITSSTGLAKDEIEKMVKNAEQYATEDKKRQEAVEIKNQADALVYNAEKTLADFGDKADPDLAAQVRDAVTRLKEDIKGDDTAKIKTGTETLQKTLYELSSKVYAQTERAGASDAPGPDAPGQEAPGEKVYDAEYDVVDDAGDKKE